MQLGKKVAGASDVPTCTVVVCTRNRPHDLDVCLRAVLHLNYPRFEVLVVDNAPSTNDARHIAARWRARYTVEADPGLSRARNLGARLANSDIVAYIDDDAIPDPDWLLGLMVEFDDSRVMAAAGQVRPTVLDTDAQQFFESIGGYTPRERGHRVLDRNTPNWFQLVNFGGVAVGTNMALRRSAFDIWAGFDERLGLGTMMPGAEEHYAFCSLVDLGYRVVYTPRAIVRHPYPRTMDELRRRSDSGTVTNVAYIGRMLVESPRHRRAMLTCVGRWLVGSTRSADPRPAAKRQRIVPRWRVLMMILPGLLQYGKSRLCANGRCGSSAELGPPPLPVPLLADLPEEAPTLDREARCRTSVG